MASFRPTLFILTVAFCLFVCFVESQNFITPAPPGPKPVEANGKLYNLYYVPDRCKDPNVLSAADLSGTLLVKDRRVLMQKYGPYYVEGNIEVSPTGCLVVMPGCQMFFSPGYGIIVNGTLIARGSDVKPGLRITMTKNPNATLVVGQSTPWPTDARLVDGNTTQDGRLDLLYHGKWRGVCTNYNNFTEIDLNVTCRHLGFVYGNFTYHSFSRNETDYMLYEKPGCKGSEDSLFDCPGRVDIKYGATVCDGQQVVGFQCTGLRPDLARDHWRGIEFYNSTTAMFRDKNKYYNKSLSFLEHLDISYAGLDTFYGDGIRHPRASISASPYVPMMNYLTVSYGAFDALNLTEIRGDIHIANSSVHHNRGYGVFIKTAVGRTLINMTDITDNWADGLKLYMVNYTINQFTKDYPADLSFCRTPSVKQTTFPIVLYEDILDPVGNKPSGFSCSKRLTTVENFMVTLHVLIMERDPEASGTITIYDGDSDGRQMLQFPINNGSFPGSVTTKTNVMTIKFDYSLPSPPPPGQDPTKRCKHMQSCIRFMMEATTNKGPDIELRLYNASVSNNTGYGVNVQDMRSKVSLNASVVSDNGYGAGVRVYQGAGEVALNNTRIERNTQSGVNITYSGGYQLFNLTTVSENYGYGVITEYLRLNRTRFEVTQQMEVVHCDFTLNQWTAFRIGNYCHGGHYLFNQSYFGFNRHETIEYLSCNISTTKSTNFSMAFNVFEANKRHAVLMNPVINTVGIFTNNTYLNHSLGVLRMDNGYYFVESRWYSKFEVNYRMYENQFLNNKGLYCVNFRLTQNSPYQSLEFKFNQLKDNSIKDSFKYLNPRSRANSVIIASSGNIKVQRNLIYNPDSVRDIATHLVDPSVVIAADRNYWETTDHSLIYGRLFDQDDRYNLAEFHYLPVLKDRWLYGDKDTDEDPEYRWDFARGDRIGGVLDGQFTTDPRIRTYHVDKDIFVLKYSTLIILPGTTFEFESSIGMVVHGRLEADGARQGYNPPQAITFTLRDHDILPLFNRTAYESLRLVDGLDEFEGRLELNISGEWGTVCNTGWTRLNSGLVCAQLGLTFNPSYGEPRVKVLGDHQKVWLNRVQCDELDTDITQCWAEQYGEFQCEHSQDVFIRCQEATWSGVAIPASPRFGTTFETQVRHLVIEKAGLLDFADMSYTPGLKIDYNFFSMSFLSVRNCVFDGISIMYSHPYSRNLLEFVNLENNLGNGIVTRSPFLQLSHLFIHNNDKAGIMYDPFFTEYQALSVRNFIYRNRTTSILDQSDIVMADNHMFFLTCPPGRGEESHTYYLQVSSTTPSFRITVQVLDYNPLTDVEKVTIFDSSRADISSGVRKWEIEKDLVDFPVISRRSVLTIKYDVRGVRTGRLALAIISKGYSESHINSRIHVYNATIQYNERGIVTKHYNNPSNEKMEIFHRAKEEEISFDSIDVRNNVEEAMFVPSLTKYHENFIPTFEEMTTQEKVGAITYIIKFANISNNGKGILAEHNHVDFANNVWKWNVTYTLIHGCKSGGFEVELPRVNDMYERQYHSVSVNESQMYNNKDFSFAIRGYYADVRINRNNFHDNQCRRGLITLEGMEKQLYVANNRMEKNYGKFAFNLDLKSHSEYSENVTGLFQFNVLKDNTYAPVAMSLGMTNTPVTYALAIIGVQKIQARRNVLVNPQLQYELVAGITALKLENKLDVKENYWGTTDQYRIRQRMFDFDDWNNFAIADFFPFLSIPNANGDLSTDTEINVILDLNHLGGRIWQDLTLPLRSTPYVVYSDLTVMPGVTFTLQPGTQLEFYPNVGLLVLGKLVATGIPYSRISMRPVQNLMVKGLAASSSQSVFQAPTNNQPVSSSIRFKGGLIPHEGFLELYNTSSRTWNLMCDSQFNEKTAEVVCRSLGYETVNVKVRFTHLYDYYVYGKPMYFIKEFWAYSYYCRGDESSLDDCLKRMNYNIKPCIFSANYTFIRCGERNLAPTMDYWGNIRFANSEYEEEIDPFIDVREYDRSRLEYVDIYGAGILHGEKVGALQTTYVTPIMTNLNISNCVSNGMDMVAPRYNVDVFNMNISRNLGYAVNILVLNGDSRDSVLSSFTPLTTNTVPYNLYGLVDICRMEKEIVVENRMILFYKYSQAAVDCVKIVRGYSATGSRPVALRFLQFSLYQDNFFRNTVEIFDSKEITDSNMLAQLVANSSEQAIRTRYSSRGDTLTVHIHASPSYGYYGFVAEVVTLPPSGFTYPDSKYIHQLKHGVMSWNEAGALLYKNVGEVTPSVIVDHCWIENNGIGILNLTSLPIIDVSIQSSRSFNLQNSFVGRNKGGTYITATTPTVATILRANITNNIFAFNTHGEVVNLTGHHFERFRLYENYFYNNTAGDFRDIIHVQNVVVNFTFNTVTNNTGYYVLRTFNEESTDDAQLFQKNYFVGNNATAVYRATINIGSGNPRINDNYLVNEECDFEIETSPRRRLENGDLLSHAPIDIKENWWGSETSTYVNGKIWDNLDNDTLIPTEFKPVRINNQSLVYGKCAPGWILESNRCFKYMGAALPYYGANDFCMENDGFLAESKNRLKFFKYLLQLTSNVYVDTMRVWVYNPEASGSGCTAFEKDYVLVEHDCYYTFHPFICEKDPYITPPGAAIYTATIIIAASVFGFALIVGTVFVVMWRIKSKRRSKQRFERQSSIRSSVRGSMKSRSTMGMLSETSSKRHLDNYSVSEASTNGIDNRGMTASVISVHGVTDGETSTDGRDMRDNYRRQGLQRSEIAKGRSESPRYDTRSDSPRQLGRNRNKYLERNKASEVAPAADSYNEERKQREAEEEERKHKEQVEVERIRNELEGQRRRKELEEQRMQKELEGQRRRKELEEQRRRKELEEERKREVYEEERQKREIYNEEKRKKSDVYASIGYSDDGYSENEFDSYTEDEEKEEGPGFNPVSFRPTVEKEQDSMQMTTLNDSSKNYIPGEDTSSISVTGQPHNLTSFTMPPSPEKNVQNGGYNVSRDDRAPTPPPPLPLNIPAKARGPKPTPGPRPVPRPRSTRSSTVSNNSELKISNIGSDKSGAISGSRNKLNEIDRSLSEIADPSFSVPRSGMYDKKSVSSRENLNQPYSSRQDGRGSRDNIADITASSGVDYLPRSSANTPARVSNDSSLSYDPMAYTTAANPSQGSLYDPVFNSSQEKLWPGRNYPREPEVPPAVNYGDGTGVDYLPRRTATPTLNVGTPRGISNPAAGYQSSPRYPDYQSSPSPHDNHGYSGYGDHGNYPTETNIDSPPAGNYPQSSQYGYNDSRPHATNLDDVYANYEDPIYQNADDPYQQGNTQQYYPPPYSAMSRSQENLRGQFSYSPGVRDDISNNSMDFDKPRFTKSIETEI